MPEPEHGLRRQAAASSATTPTTWPSRPTSCSTTRSSTTAWRTWTSASRWSRRPTRRCSRRPSRPPSPHGDIHGYKTIADIMRALNPFTGSFYLETLQVARYTREMYCLFGGRHTHPSTIMPGGVSADITHQTLHGLLRAADALHGVRQAHRADARRPLRLLPAGAAGVRHGRLPRHRPRLLGLLRRPRLRRLRLQEHDRVGPAPLHHAGPRLQGRADHDRPRRDQPRDAHPARQLVLRRLVERGDVRHAGPARQPGRQAPPVEQGRRCPSRRSATGRTSTAGSCRRACTTSATTPTSPATPAAARSRASG